MRHSRRNQLFDLHYIIWAVFDIGGTVVVMKLLAYASHVALSWQLIFTLISAKQVPLSIVRLAWTLFGLARAKFDLYHFCVINPQ